MECPETKKRNTPQPEMLLRDTISNGRVAIERKQIVDPEYAAGHNNDHILADMIEEALLPHLTDGVFQLELPHLVRGSRPELRGFAAEITNGIKQNLLRVRDGTTIGSSRQGRRWSFRTLSSFEILPDESAPDLRIEPTRPFPSCEERGKAREKEVDFVTQQIRKFRTACREKFKDYPDAKKILLVELVGDLSVGEADWSPILDAAKPFDPIDEIWLADYDWIDHEERAYQFKQIFATPVTETIL